MFWTSARVGALAVVLVCWPTVALTTGAQEAQAEYRVLETAKTGTLQRELQEAADAGYRLTAGQGVWPTSAILEKAASSVEPVEYLLLSTSKSGTMQKEMDDASARGYRFATVVGSDKKEVALVMQRPRGSTARTHEQVLLATSSISTMERELRAAAAKGFHFAAQTLFERLLGGPEYVSILERPVP